MASTCPTRSKSVDMPQECQLEEQRSKALYHFLVSEWCLTIPTTLTTRSISTTFDYRVDYKTKQRLLACVIVSTWFGGLCSHFRAFRFSCSVELLGN
ncbi:hypothetical protein VNO80_26056 [Phaseolus coccineus]|uniref:Uncharacterized protein n=1 Tax=Phaseolus coccineus TaxID=3886 RepID=A0AAN9LZR1_PHACN